MKTRVEKDPMGEREVPADAYYGIQTARAIENFPISGLKPFPAFVKATALIKLAAARVNARAGALKANVAQAIEKAAQEVVEGKLADQFVVDVFQAGAGTSHNMNVNEVIANRANELIGLQRGDTSQIHPNDHVNLGQSTNDVIPTAMRLSALELSKPIVEVTRQAAATLQERAQRFSTVVKSGRIAQIGTQHRSEPYQIAVRDLLKTGALGDISKVEIVWNTSRPVRPSSRWKSRIEKSNRCSRATRIASLPSAVATTSQPFAARNSPRQSLSESSSSTRSTRKLCGIDGSGLGPRERRPAKQRSCRIHG